MSEEASFVTGDGGSDLGSRGSGENWSDSGYSLKGKLIDGMWGVKKEVRGDTKVT